MCGIAGIFTYGEREQRIDRSELLRMREAMYARGPDGSGLWISATGAVGLAHRRLAIVDLSDSGAQPMASLDGRFQVVFNGEIYNYLEIRRELESDGVVFLSNSDTEVLLHLYARKGVDMVNSLRGMYAFAVWDELKQSLLLVRDPFGIKPLYYADDGKTIRFASQVKALLAGGNVDTRLEPAGHTGFFLWGSIPEPFTLYKGIRSIESGTWLQVSIDGRHIRKHFCSISTVITESAEAGASYSVRDADAAIDELRGALLNSVKHHMIADVPVGVFLSSGLDSTTLLGLACDAEVDHVNTVTLGFSEYVNSANDETKLAEKVSAHYKSRHKTVWVAKQDFQAELDNVIRAMDQPSIDGINTYFVAKAARASGLKVALSGIGGDELFAGYSSFRDVPRIISAVGIVPFASHFGRTFRRVTAPLLRRITSPKYAGLFEYGNTWGGAYLLRRGMYMPWELPDVLDPDTASEGWAQLECLPRLEKSVAIGCSDHLRVSSLELNWYLRNQLLRDADWAAMAHSLEIRTPLIDIELLKSVATLLGAGAALDKTKMALAPSRPLPDEVMNRPKTGFSIPVRDWIVESRGGGERGLRGWAKTVYQLAWPRQ